MGRLDEKLEHEARHLTPVQSVGCRIVQQGNVLRTLYEAVEVVGIHGVLMLDGSHAERLAQVIGDERRIAARLGELPFVEGQHDEVAEVEVTRFQYAHYLHADGGLAVKRYVGGGEQAVHQAFQRVCMQAQPVILYQAEQAVDEGVALE